MNLKALKQRLAAISAEAKTLLDAADADSGTLTDEQATAFDALMDEKTTVEANIKRAEQFEAMRASMGRVSTPAAVGNSAEIGNGAVTATDRREYDPMCGFASAAEFGTAVRAASRAGGDFDERLNFGAAPSNYHTETASSDGYMVPPQVREEVWNLIASEEGLLQKMQPEPTSSNAVELTVDDSTPWSSDGIQAYWVGEGKQITGSRVKTAGRTVKLHKVAALVEATEEILEDAPRLQNRLTVGAAGAINYAIDDAIVNGNGVARPLGFHNAANGSLVVVAKDSGQAATTITATNVLNMRSRLLAPRGGGAFWIANSDTIAQLATLTIGNQPMFLSAPAGLLNDPYAVGLLLGLPLYFSEHCSTLGAQGDIMLVAPGGYYAAIKGGGLKFAASMHLFFDYDVQAFKWTFRVAGQPMLQSAISPAKGSNTKSHAITLAVRS